MYKSINLGAKVANIFVFSKNCMKRYIPVESRHDKAFTVDCEIM